MQLVYRLRGISPVLFTIINKNNVAVAAIKSFSSTTCIKSAEKIEVTVENNGVRKIVINRPEAKNAFSFAMMDKLGTVLKESNTDSSTKIITLTGVGNFFSSGSDLNNWKDGSVDEVKAKDRKYLMRQMMYGFIDCRKPIIAMVNGPAVGAGVTLLPLCDQVLANDKAFFVTPFTALGIVPEFCSSYLFPKIMGLPKANDVLLFGHKLTAQEALQCGFITKVFPAESFVESCQKLIDAYAKLPMEPLVKSKELIRGPEIAKLKECCAYEMNYINEAADGPVVKESLRRFFSGKQ